MAFLYLFQAISASRVPSEICFLFLYLYFGGFETTPLFFPPHHMDFYVEVVLK